MTPGSHIETKYQALQAALGHLGSVVVAFSGGVDSALLLRVAHDVLGDGCVGLTARSPSVPASEIDEAQRLASELGVRLLIVESGEIADPRYAANPPDRCFYCKSELFTICRREATRLGIGWVADGLNADDLSDHRPGIAAAAEQGVAHPLADAGLTKDEIRALARRLGMEIWDKPAAACLASRFPYGTEITNERLGRVERCEAVLKEMGFRGLRVRFHGEVARIELASADIPRITQPDLRDAVVKAFQEAGFLYVCVDLQGYRMGSLNEALTR